ncbi:MAG: lipopolysaccharide core heptose(I) kinase RfaP [Gammaproteobacteria bacterium]|nr:MAG: lipopolysaccharide core heptose(I) kinase RfaP [Gammaproteobacteria bacterium]
MQKKVLYLRTDLAKRWQGQDVFSVVQQLQGDIFRHKEGRRTLRVVLGEKSFFLKWHQGVGWLEIIKNFLQLRAPIISAKNEWRAIRFLENHQIDTMTIAAYGERGLNPAKRWSFLITDELTDTMCLEYVGQQWRQTPPSFKTKVTLIRKLALIAKGMHENGMNHRDFYLCHFLLDKTFAENNTIEEDTRLFLIDLHRAQIRSKTPSRWIIKDLGSLYFSAVDVLLTKRDLFRFMMMYSGDNLRDIVGKKHEFWTKVNERADKLLAE